ncbi:MULTISPECIES: carbonic anhydrase [unclassified Nocardioides]|uniref:beta-class carbonic anhydrase n=1 Tax=unclassified Nocardioides TaxID=2615069 RepID=UPI001151D2BE|nr:MULTISPECIES: carbonic anhydrase [unclassified Nocardioides]TQK71708.1 carbonic anhydrase [Nocardioides sp. SLBN-35]WGY04114.1 carbonic anhydrase [Nocardioides sp. QY071]
MGDFDDLLKANQEYAADFKDGGFDGIARAGIGLVTCMDSRIDPLGLTGLKPGDAKMIRNPGGRVDDLTLDALVISVHMLNVDRIMIIPHTRCAVASNSEAALRERLDASTGQDTSWLTLPVTDGQAAALVTDVQRVRAHPLIPDSVKVGGFIYDVDTGLLTQEV